MEASGSTDHALFHLSACVDIADAFGETDARGVLGHGKSPWPDLMAAIVVGLERGWVGEVHVIPRGKTLYTEWTPTERGERAMRAFRARLECAPVEDET